jgi:HAD superfamily hydrolase (TIGR01509 family)
VVFCSGDEGVAKPDPVAFKVTLERLDVESEEAVFIDDTIGHVKAAQTLGLKGILFTTAEMVSQELKTLIDL